MVPRTYTIDRSGASDLTKVVKKFKRPKGIEGTEPRNYQGLALPQTARIEVTGDFDGSFLPARLVYRDAETGLYVPYLTTLGLEVTVWFGDIAFPDGGFGNQPLVGYRTLAMFSGVRVSDDGEEKAIFLSFCPL